MDLNWIDEAIQEERRKDMLRAAAQRRLVAQARASRRPKRLYSGALVWLGRWLEAWGRRLQARYGALTETGIVTTIRDRATGC